MSNIVKLADGVFIKNFSVKRKLIHADLEIDISRYPYFGRWLCDGAVNWKCGNEDDTKMVIHLRKVKQNWDEPFWKAIEKAFDNGTDEVPNLEKLIKKVSKRPVEFAAKKQEEKVVNRILNKAW